MRRSILNLPTEWRKRAPSDLNSVYANAGWRSLSGPILESYSGAWQQNVTETSPQTLLSFSAVFCCVTGISSDIAKLRPKLSRKVKGIWEEIEAGSPFLPVLRKPNKFQNWIQFLTHWVISKLEYGNAYVLLERDNRGGEGRGVVSAMYVLDPARVWALVSESSGDVYYQLGKDRLSDVEDSVVVSASEIIHDRMNTLWHPLLGVSPLYACAMSAYMGGKIQADSSTFFANRSMPGGMLTAPGLISQETAERLKVKFEENLSGANIGRLFVGGDGLKFEPFKMTAEQAQLIEQLKWSVGDVARAFHYPEFKMGGPMPPYSGNMQALTLSYYTDCLQILIESIEMCLDEAMGLAVLDFGIELDIDNLLRMDTATLFESNNKAVQGRWMAPNEARFRANLAAVKGGQSPLAQHQDYSLEAIAKRNEQDDPFASKAAPVPANPAPAGESEDRGFDVAAFNDCLAEEMQPAW